MPTNKTGFTLTISLTHLRMVQLYAKIVFSSWEKHPLKYFSMGIFPVRKFINGLFLLLVFFPQGNNSVFILAHRIRISEI